MLNGTTKEWRGIPYAAPPLGALRWRLPACNYAVPPGFVYGHAHAFP